MNIYTQYYEFLLYKNKIMFFSLIEYKNQKHQNQWKNYDNFSINGYLKLY